MIYVKAESIVYEIHKKINKLREGRIHSIYSDVINLELRSGKIISVGKLSVGNGPFNILIDYNDDFRSVRFIEGEKFEINNEGITFLESNIKINFSDTVVWYSDWKVKPNLTLLSENIKYLEELVIKKGDMRGIGFLLTKDLPQNNVFPEKTVERIKEKVSDIDQRIFRNNAYKVFEEFIGLGPGLTPSGDDFVSGFLYTWNYAVDYRLLDQIDLNYDEWVSLIDKKTNKVSKMDLWLALNDKPLEVVKKVIESLYGLNKFRVYNSVIDLIGRGSTSGTDILTGIIISSKLVLEKNS